LRGETRWWSYLRAVCHAESSCSEALGDWGEQGSLGRQPGVVVEVTQQVVEPSPALKLA